MSPSASRSDTSTESFQCETDASSSDWQLVCWSSRGRDHWRFASSAAPDGQAQASSHRAPTPRGAFPCSATPTPPRRVDPPRGQSRSAYPPSQHLLPSTSHHRSGNCRATVVTRGECCPGRASWLHFCSDPREAVSEREQELVQPVPAATWRRPSQPTLRPSSPHHLHLQQVAGLPKATLLQTSVYGGKS